MADPFTMAVISVAMNAAVMAMTMMNEVEGPRLKDLTISTADYGTPLPNLYGTKRIECLCFYAEPMREEKETSKGKGGKYAEYKYFGTWASMVADHELDAVLKIWLDRHLVHNQSAIGPISPLAWVGISLVAKESLGEKILYGTNMRIYLGTDDQRIDPRMAATTDDEEGPGRCPAYLNVAYVMFEDIPLEPFGNRMPQVSAIGLRAHSEEFPFESVDKNLGLTNATYSPDFRRMTIAGDSSFDVWDIPGRRLVFTGSQGISDMRGEAIGVLQDGSFFQVQGFASQSLWLVGAFGGASQVTFIPFLSFAGGCAYKSGHVLIYPYSHLFKEFQVLSGISTVVIPCAFIPTCFFQTIDGEVRAIGKLEADGSTTGIGISGLSGGGITMASPATGYVGAFDNGEGQYVAFQGGWLHLIDATSLTIVASSNVGSHGTDQELIFRNIQPGSPTFWMATTEYSSTDLSVLRTVDPADWLPEDVTNYLYDGVNHALICEPQFDPHFTWRYLDRKAATGVPLSFILEDVALLAGMEEGEYDFAELDQDVPGYSWTQGPAKSIVDALLQIHDSDVRPHGFVQEGKKRGQLLSGPPISSDWMVPDGDKPLYSVPLTSETDLPRRVFATFADPAHDEQPNTVIAQRSAVSVKSKRETSYDLSTMRSTSDEIQSMADRALRRAWVGATRPECTLTPLEIRLEPADVRNLVLDGERLRCRNTRTVIKANRAIETRWEVDGETPLIETEWGQDDLSPLNTVFSAPGGFSQREPDVILIPQRTKGFIFDTPLLADSHDQTAPFAYIAAAPEFTGYWPGSTMWHSDSNEEDTFASGFATFTSSMACVWGAMMDVLSDALPDVIDRGSEVEVMMLLGDELTSVTEEELLADSSLNLALIGDPTGEPEIVQFTTAVLVDTDRYRLSGFIRGARGTEYAIAGHGASEFFVLINSAVRKQTLGAGEIGDTDYYKFTTIGDHPALNATHELAYAGNSHRPLSPAHLTFARDSGTGDWTIEWVRRTRIGGSTVNGQDVPLGEASESYRWKIMDGETALRTADTVTPSATYTAAQQIADWGALVYAPPVRICQLSPALSLEGFPTIGSGNAHRYWRVWIEANQGDATLTQLAEIEMRNGPGGTDLTGSGGAISGGAGSDVGAASLAFDDTASGWVRSATGLCYIGYDFETPTGISEITITATAGLLNRSPKDIMIDWSDDGENWTTALTEFGMAAWSASEQRLFTIA